MKNTTKDAATMNLTAHQIATLRTILRSGGHAGTTNGRATPGYLRTTTCENLRRAGLLSQVWTAKHTITKPGESTYDYFYFVTAKGCIALNEIEMREAEEADATAFAAMRSSAVHA